MSKSILVMDTPEACIDCPCHFTEDTGRVGCGKEKKELWIDDIIGSVLRIEVFY